MKRIIVLVLAMVFMAALAQAQTPAAPAPQEDLRAKYIEERIGRLNADFQLVQGDLNAIARKYPPFFGEKGMARKEIEAVLNAVARGIQAEVTPLAKELSELRKAEKPKEGKK